jgi:hypothetical protein
MLTTTFEIAGIKATGLQAEAHFVEWALSLEQEGNKALLELASKERYASEASRIFQVAAYQDYQKDWVHCLEVVRASGITITRA